jgi:hypothetical protein
LANQAAGNGTGAALASPGSGAGEFLGRSGIGGQLSAMSCFITSEEASDGKSGLVVSMPGRFRRLCRDGPPLLIKQYTPDLGLEGLIPGNRLKIKEKHISKWRDREACLMPAPDYAECRGDRFARSDEKPRRKLCGFDLARCSP